MSQLQEISDTEIRGLRRAGQLPARVIKLILRRQRESERLIGWLQFGLIVFMGLLYSAAPKTFDAEASFAPVPFVLASYFVFTLLRLWLSFRTDLPRWYLCLSILADLALLYGLIWSFHLQYEQPPSFYLKAPTLLYVFIFIALRALRFEPFYILFTGICAALGWGVMFLYVLQFDAMSDMITSDYVTYLTSNSILIGAKIDKIVSILLVTFILAAAIHRGRTVVVEAAVERTATQELSRFFAPGVAETITSAEQSLQPGQGEIRDAAILMADIRGFTQMATELPPNEVMALLAEYEKRMGKIINENGGSIDKFLGDGILATFGVVRESDDQAAQALRALEGLLRETTNWADQRISSGLRPLEIGFSVATGKVVFGAVGDEQRLEMTVIGDAVNLAAKLEKHNKAEKVSATVAAGTFQKALNQGYQPRMGHSSLENRRVDGLNEPTDLVVFH
jgi:adenylate cyclase